MSGHACLQHVWPWGRGLSATARFVIVVRVVQLQAEAASCVDECDQSQPSTRSRDDVCGCGCRRTWTTTAAEAAAYHCLCLEFASLNTTYVLWYQYSVVSSSVSSSVSSGVSGSVSSSSVCVLYWSVSGCCDVDTYCVVLYWNLHVTHWMGECKFRRLGLAFDL